MDIKARLQDIRFYIALFFVIRLFGITNPPLEVAHNWRQTTVTMVARNFLETDNNIFFPRIDIAGEKTGITGMEFPLLNYFIYLTAKITGYHHWYGRLINLLVSSMGLWFFFKLLQKYFNPPTAFYSTLILTVSIWFQFSRKIMPDTFSMSLIIACLYFGTNYLESQVHSTRQLLVYGLLLMLGLLTKLPSGFVLVVFLFFLMDDQINSTRKLFFAAVSILGILPSLLWYFYWVPHLVHTYEFEHFFMGKDWSIGASELFHNLNQTFSRFYDTALKFIGFAVFIFGLVVAIRQKQKKIVWPFALCLLAFVAVMIKSGFNFPHHSYYIIPFVPVMALVAGFGLASIKIRGLALVLIVCIAAEGLANQQHDFFIKENALHILNLESDLNQVSKPDDLILINSGDYPTPMYFAHRKGWVNSNEAIVDKNYVNDLTKRGLKYIVILKRCFGSEIILPQYQKVLENEDYCIYEL